MMMQWCAYFMMFNWKVEMHILTLWIAKISDFSYHLFLKHELSSRIQLCKPSLSFRLKHLVEVEIVEIKWFYSSCSLKLELSTKIECYNRNLTFVFQIQTPLGTQECLFLFGPFGCLPVEYCKTNVSLNWNNLNYIGICKKIYT